jgi:hypothetical protein
MPAKSQAQYRFMQAAAHDPEVAKRAGISQGAAKEYVSGQSPHGLPERKAVKKAAGKLAKKKGK